jgi:hypothetical protein
VSNGIITKNLEKSIMLSKLNDTKSSIILESTNDSLNSYATIEFPDFLVGVMYEEESIYPKVMKTHNTNYYIIAIDEVVYQLDVNEKKLIWKVELESYFIDAIEIQSKGLLIIEEIGVGLYDDEGKCIWSKPTDLVESYLVEQDILIINTDSGKVKLSTEDGKDVY